MRTQSLVMCLTLRIILSSEVTRANPPVKGKINYTNSLGSKEWEGTIYSETNMMCVLFNKSSEEELTEALKSYPATWTLIWTNTEGKVDQEEISLPMRIKDPGTENISLVRVTYGYVFIMFDRTVTVKVPDCEPVHGVLDSMKVRTFSEYLMDSTSITVYGPPVTLTTFKEATQQLKQIKAYIYNLGNEICYDITSPLSVGNVISISSDGSKATFMIEIPLLMTLTINNINFEGIVDLKGRQIRLFVSKEEIEPFQKNQVQLVGPHTADLVEQAVYLRQKFTANFHNLSVCQKTDSTPAITEYKPGNFEVMLQFKNADQQI